MMYTFVWIHIYLCSFCLCYKYYKQKIHFWSFMWSHTQWTGKFIIVTWEVICQLSRHHKHSMEYHVYLTNLIIVCGLEVCKEYDNFTENNSLSARHMQALIVQTIDNCTFFCTHVLELMWNYDLLMLIPHH